MKKSLITVVISLFSALILFAQDRIIKLDRTEISCKVSEIGSIEIKYKKADNPDGPVYSIHKTEVFKIVFENGTEEIMQQNDMAVIDFNKAARRYTRAITTRPFSPTTGFVSIGYQRALSRNRAFVSELGIIGPKIGSSDWGYKDSGVFLRAGYRLKRVPEVVMQGMEWGYNLGGFYLQPEITLAFFNSEPASTSSIFSSPTNFPKTSVTSGAFLITIGRQMIFGDRVTFDIGGSIGYGFTNWPTDGIFNNTTEYPSRVQYYGYVLGDTGSIAFGFTMSMGILLK